MRGKSNLRIAAERAIEAWDTTVLHTPSDGMLQERMETLREALKPKPIPPPTPEQANREINHT